ncbi:transposase [bacterium]|nr:transposase [bacterium]
MSVQLKTEKGCYYHIYNRGVDRKQLFFDRKDYGFFSARLVRYSKDNQICILAHCIMPNHFHLLLHIEDSANDNALPKMMHRLQTSYAVYFNKRYNHSGYVFQGRYSGKQVKTTKYLVWLVCYIHLNPQDGGVVENFQEWEYSSHAHYSSFLNNPLLNHKLIDLSYSEIIKEYLGRREEKKAFLEDYMLD